MVNNNEEKDSGVIDSSISSSISSSIKYSEVSTYKCYMYLVHKQYYTDILYLINKKGFTYKSELKKIKYNNWEHYLRLLESKNIIQKIKIPYQEVCLFVRQANVSDYHARKTVFYGFTPEFKKVLSNSPSTDISILQSNTQKLYFDYQARMKMMLLEWDKIDAEQEDINGIRV